MRVLAWLKEASKYHKQALRWQITYNITCQGLSYLQKAKCAESVQSSTPT